MVATRLNYSILELALIGVMNVPCSGIVQSTPKLFLASNGMKGAVVRVLRYFAYPF